MSYRSISIALTIPFVIAILPRPAQAQSAAATTCLSNAACRVAVVVWGGITYWQMIQNGQTTRLRYEQGEILEDPEGESEEWSDRIWANSPTDAQNKCRLYAQVAGVVYVKVEHIRGSAYRCVVRTLRA